ncbi:hypothetical protein [Mesorhizobium delmotii]|uniref:Uncharacterized protein n=1 Tax=Mesorhizobium delmotii TaxID=1631247 RepID=A0A2P9AN94_9HYPH|nr:hypothetical protein [Mesorhizobium delmotii]SJM32538.1 hypothetical protein BQ8482_290133 [Mesorhizobium delmotii]
MVEESRLALHWQAHDLFYGLPIIVDEWLATGDVVVANGSRSILAEARISPAEDRKRRGVTGTDRWAPEMPWS